MLYTPDVHGKVASNKVDMNSNLNIFRIFVYYILSEQLHT